MQSFSLNKNHPNFLRPGKRPAHTLNSYIVCDENSAPILIGGTPGADDQVQVNLQVIFNVIDLE